MFIEPCIIREFEFRYRERFHRCSSQFIRRRLLNVRAFLKSIVVVQSLIYLLYTIIYLPTTEKEILSALPWKRLPDFKVQESDLKTKNPSISLQSVLHQSLLDCVNLFKLLHVYADRLVKIRIGEELSGITENPV